MVRVHACLLVEKHIRAKSLKLTSTVKWYDQNAKKFDSLISSLAIPEHIDTFRQQLFPKALVLDAGCGSGRDTALLEAKQLTLTGLDLSTELLKIAQEKCPQVKFVQGNLLDLPFKNESFDGVWANACLVHLKNNAAVKKSLSEFHRVLKKGGVLHIFVRANLGGKKVLFHQDSQSRFKRLFHNFTQTEVTSLLFEAGFKELFTTQTKEIDQHPQGRADVEWIHSISKKI